MLLVVIILVIADNFSNQRDDKFQDDLEAASDKSSQDDENIPPAYEDVIEHEDKTCPSYNTAVEMEG